MTEFTFGIGLLVQTQTGFMQGANFGALTTLTFPIGGFADGYGD